MFQHISSRRHRDGVAGKPNPLLSRHKKRTDFMVETQFVFLTDIFHISQLSPIKHCCLGFACTILKALSHLVLFFLDFLKGTSKNSGARTFTKSFGCCCSNGSRSLLQSAGTTFSLPNLAPSSPSPPPTGNTPQPAEACPGSHPHHTWANPLHSLLMARE